MVDVLLLGKGRVHHDPVPLMVNAIILDELQEVDADHSGIGLAFEVVFHVPVKLQTVQGLDPGLEHDVGQVALSAGRLQDNTGAVQLGHPAHLLRNGAGRGEELVLLFEVNRLAGHQDVVQQLGGVAVSEHMALGLAVPLAADVDQHLVHGLIGGPVKLAVREKEGVPLHAALPKDAEDVVSDPAHG